MVPDVITVDAWFFVNVWYLAELNRVVSSSFTHKSPSFKWTSKYENTLYFFIKFPIDKWVRWCNTWTRWWRVAFGDARGWTFSYRKLKKFERREVRICNILKRLAFIYDFIKLHTYRADWVYNSKTNVVSYYTPNEL